MRRTVLSLGAVAVILLSSFCGMQIVTDSGCGEPVGGTVGPLSWSIEDGFTLSVTGEGNMPSYSSTEPPWKQYHETITDIVVGEGVAKLGINAFKGMDHVTTVSLPESLTMIDNGCFEDCTALESITIPDSVTSPGRNTFRNCTSLQTAVFGDGSTYVGQYTFSGCSSLESVILGESVASVGDYCFQNCTSLLDVDFDEALTSIGQYCFQNCASLETVDLPSGLLEMKGYCFSGSGINEIVIPDSCTEVWRYSFLNCTSLVSVVYPAHITYVGVSCFQGCTALETIVFGGSETEIRDNAFNGCSSLYDAWLPESLQTVGKNAFKNCSSLTEVILYEDVTSVGTYAFQNCSSMTELTLGSSMATIDTGAFRDCSQLATIYNASSMELTAGSSDSGFVARYAQDIVPVIPYSASYTASDGLFASQTVYASGEDVSFRVRPADPTREGYAFDGWTDGTGLYEHYGTVTLPVDDLNLAATWASLVIVVEADDQETVDGSPISYQFEITGEGRMQVAISSVNGGEASLNGYTVSFLPDETDTTVNATIILTVTNGHASADLTTEVLVDPVFSFTNTSLDGSLAGEVEL